MEVSKLQNELDLNLTLTASSVFSMSGYGLITLESEYRLEESTDPLLRFLGIKIGVIYTTLMPPREIIIVKDTRVNKNDG